MPTHSGAPTRGRPPGSDAATVLAIARRLFVEGGYRGTTMDAVAASAGVSKQSLYRDHPSKDALFAAVVRDWVEQGREVLGPFAAELARCTVAREGLVEFAGVLQTGLLSPGVLQMRTLVAAEAVRFPEVAAGYARDSWRRNLRTLADALTELDRRGLLAVDDAVVAAEQLTWLTVGGPLNRRTLDPHGRPAGTAELAAVVDEGVTTFLARYAPA